MCWETVTFSPTRSSGQVFEIVVVSLGGWVLEGFKFVGHSGYISKVPELKVVKVGFRRRTDDDVHYIKKRKESMEFADSLSLSFSTSAPLDHQFWKFLKTILYLYRADVCKSSLVANAGVIWCSNLLRNIASLFLFLQQCPGCLLRFILIVFEMSGRWPYSCCFVGRCVQDMFKTQSSIFVLFPSRFFPMRFLSV